MPAAKTHMTAKSPHIVAGFCVFGQLSRHVFSGVTVVGCLPLPLLFLLGALIGHLFGGDIGMLWGSGIGFVLGLVSAAVFIWLVRGRR
ncbi:hypothetical protein DWU98_16040 [Dyella monticola]|uniref:Uncharacterized protein n=1 Tax=Dyella monticola TaxID=1927958 RepID=A0A370WUZ4_9GAMM|nr:hypothetical protein [Dyella monticola]RDS79949.1 hypothetical protein DWU98_16040 [Dyella monticola]